MATPFRTILTNDQNLNQIQQNITAAFNALNGPYFGGNLITGISLSANVPKIINHGLGRQPQLWTLADLTAAAEIYRVSWNSTSIVLEATANCTIAVWVN